MNNRNYPVSMFVMGIILNSLKLWWLLAISILFFTIKLFTPLPSIIPYVILIIWLIIAVIKQFGYTNIMLESTDNEEFNILKDKMFTNKQTGYKNVIDAVNEIIDKSKT